MKKIVVLCMIFSTPHSMSMLVAKIIKPKSSVPYTIHTTHTPDDIFRTQTRLNYLGIPAQQYDIDFWHSSQTPRLVEELNILNGELNLILKTDHVIPYADYHTSTDITLQSSQDKHAFEDLNEVLDDIKWQLYTRDRDPVYTNRVKRHHYNLINMVTRIIKDCIFPHRYSLDLYCTALHKKGYTTKDCFARSNGQWPINSPNHFIHGLQQKLNDNWFLGVDSEDVEKYKKMYEILYKE